MSFGSRCILSAWLLGSGDASGGDDGAGALGGIVAVVAGGAVLTIVVEVLLLALALALFRVYTECCACTILVLSQMQLLNYDACIIGCW